MPTSTLLPSFGSSSFDGVAAPINTGLTYTPFNGNNGGNTSADSLTLLGGMTAGWGNSGETQNPSLPGSASNGAAINPYGGNPNWPVSRVGLLRNVPGSLSEQYTLNFLYNPGEVDVAFTVDQSAMPSNYLFGTGNNDSFNTTTAPITAAQTVSWTLLFDRTYDMMYDPDPNGNRGVLKDIGALYLLMGTFVSNAAVPMSTLCEVVFGQTDNGDIWGFTGFISGASIAYPIFRHNMIPSRASVQLTMITTYVAAGPPPGGTSGSGAAALPAGATTNTTNYSPSPAQRTPETGVP
jgi:hypothetical protein